MSQSSLSRIDTTQGGTGGGDSDDETIPDDSDDESDVVGSFFFHFQKVYAQLDLKRPVLGSVFITV